MRQNKTIRISCKIKRIVLQEMHEFGKSASDFSDENFVLTTQQWNIYLRLNKNILRKISVTFSLNLWFLSEYPLFVSFMLI